MKKRVLLLGACLLGFAGYVFSRTITPGLYCERAESYESSAEDAISRAAELEARAKQLKNYGETIKRLQAQKAQEKILAQQAKLQAQISYAQQQMAALNSLTNSNTKRASRVPALPRISLPKQYKIGGQDFTCAYFDTAPATGDGWEITKDGQLALDANAGFYGLDRDQFPVNPATMKKIQAELSTGKVLYKVKSDVDFVG